MCSVGDATIKNIPEVTSLYLPQKASTLDTNTQLGILSSEAAYPALAVASHRQETMLTADIKLSRRAEVFVNNGLFCGK